MYLEAKDTGHVPTQASSVTEVFSGVIMPKSLGPVLSWWEKEGPCPPSHLEAPLKPRSALLSMLETGVLTTSSRFQCGGSVVHSELTVP